MMEGFRAKLSPLSKPPPPPPKDKIYLQSSMSTASLNPPHSFASYSTFYGSSSHDNLSRPDQETNRMQSPSTPAQSIVNRTFSPVVSVFSVSQSPSSPATPSFNAAVTNEFNALKKGFNKGFSKISSLSRRPFSPKPNMKSSPVEVRVDTPDSYSDESISRPWNFQHHLHVDEGLGALPQEWLSSLRSAGLTDEEILAIHIRRQQQKEREQREQLSSPGLASSPTPYSSSSISSLSSIRSISSPPTPPAPPAPITVAISPPRNDSLGRLSQLSDTTVSTLPYPSYRIDTTSLSISHPYASKAGCSPVSPSEASILTVTDKGSKEEKSGTTPTTPVSQNILFALKSFNPGLGLAPEAQPLNNTSTISSSLESVERATSMLEKAASMADSTMDTTSFEAGDQKRLSVSFSSTPPQRTKRRPAELSLVSGGSSHSRSRSDTSLLYTPPLLPPPSGPPPSPPRTPETLRDSDVSPSVNSSDGVRSPSPPIINLPRLSIETGLENGLNWSSVAGQEPPRLSLPHSLDIDLGDWSESLFSVLRRQTSAKSVSSKSVSRLKISERSSIKNLEISSPQSAGPSPSNTFDSSSSVYSVPSTSAADGETDQLSTPDDLTSSSNPTPTDISHNSPNHLTTPQFAYSDSATSLSPLFEEVLDLVGQSVLLSPARSTLQDSSPILPRSSATDSVFTAQAFYGDLLEDGSSNLEGHTNGEGSVAEDAYASLSPRTATWSEVPSDHNSSSPSTNTFQRPVRRFSKIRRPSRASSRNTRSYYSRSSGSSSHSRSFSVASTSSLSNEAMPMRFGIIPPTVRVQSPGGQNIPDAETESVKSDLILPTGGVTLHRSASALVHDWIADSTASVLAYEQEEDVDDDDLSVYGLEPGSEQLEVVDSPSSSHSKSQNQGPPATNPLVTLRPLPQVLLPMSPTESVPSTLNSAPEKYRGWLFEVLLPLEEFLDDGDPRKIFTDLQEIAEGEHGSVYAARVARPSSNEKEVSDGDMVAIKNMPMTPSGSPKLEQLRRELMLTSKISHNHILSMSNLYIDLVEDALWIQMELMERSLADILALVAEGLLIGEEVIGRFIHDTLQALAYLESNNIAHRDVRSDNLLVNGSGYLKLADFSNAVHIDASDSMCSEVVGVVYWQAPEMRRGAYDARKVDVWSVGATMWELAEAEPPFTGLEDLQNIPEMLPELSNSISFTQQFYDFLSMCTLPPKDRPTAHELLQTSFIRSACARPIIGKLLSRCRDIEEILHRRRSDESQGTILQ